MYFCSVASLQACYRSRREKTTKIRVFSITTGNCGTAGDHAGGHAGPADVTALVVEVKTQGLTDIAIGLVQESRDKG